MAKGRGVDAKLSRLRALGEKQAGPEVVAELRLGLADSSNLVVAEAAEIVGKRMLVELVPDLVTAFARFMIEPKKSDRLCKAKTAIVAALNQLEQDQEAIFLQGIHHVQKELFWDERVEDTATTLRADSAFALVRTDYPKVLLLLVDLLRDQEPIVRKAAVQALRASGATAAIPLLRFKARLDDVDPEVTGECLTALMHLAPEESLPFVTEFLDAPRVSLQEGAAFALSESRRPEALTILMDFWPRARGGELEEVVLLAISMMRLPAALDFLLTILNEKNKSAGQAALAALKIHRHNESLKERIAAAVARKGDPILMAQFKAKFTAN